MSDRRAGISFNWTTNPPEGEGTHELVFSGTLLYNALSYDPLNEAQIDEYFQHVVDHLSAIPSLEGISPGAISSVSGSKTSTTTNYEEFTPTQPE